MAKQRGIHQISGKINDLVYYQQKYVEGGLIRRQNQAMSERVKSAPEFAGTRKAGKEFGYCSQSAAAIIKIIPQRAASIVNPFILPQFTKYLYNTLKSSGGSAGSRTLTNSKEFAASIGDFINSMAKNKWQGVFPSLYFPVLINRGNNTLSLEIDTLAVQQFCVLYDFYGIRFTIYDGGKITFGEAQVDGTYTRTYREDFALRARFTVSVEDSSDITETYFVQGTANSMPCAMVLAEPVRDINGVKSYPVSARSFYFAAMYSDPNP